MKRMIRVFLCLCFILLLLPATKASAATLAELQQKFPHGAYWNHVAGNGHYYSNYNDVGSCNNPDGYTWSPCYSHTANAPYGQYDCNSFNGGMQCCGFARKLAYDAYGSYATSWTNYTYDAASSYMWNSLKPGDVLHYTGGNADPTYGHWVFVIAVNGNAITVGECNVYNAPCQIRWGNVIYKGNISPVRVCVAPYALDNSNASLITWTDSLSDPSETDAYIKIRANAPYSGSWGEVGITVWDANSNVVAQKAEWAASNATNYLDIWYNLTAETGAVLKRNTDYTYQFYVYFNNVCYKSDIGSFTTDPCSNHTVVTVKGKAATCTESGLKDGKKCSVCGTITVKQEVIPATGHTKVIDKKVEATCSKNGKTEGSHCSVCGYVIKKQETIKATGKHVYDDKYDAKCNVCGFTRQAVESVPMFRMYDPNSSEHFYTGSTVERDNLIKAGWNYEGVGFNFPKAGSPVHRLYHKPTGEHLYTMDEKEKADLLANGWTYEGVAFNSADPEDIPQYRLHNPNATRGAYHFTSSTEERDMLISIGWELQGIGWYSCLK